MRKDTDKAKELLGKVRHAAMATVNPDGSPHNTPLFFIYNEALSKIYWGSHPGSRHSQNIRQNNQVYVVVFDSFTQGKGGLYITAINARQITGKELDEGLAVHNAARARFGKEPLELAYYIEGPQRMYSADIADIEIYQAERDTAGRILREVRQPITAKELLDD